VRGDFHIDDWLIQPQLNLICRADQSVHIEPKAMHVLEYLAGRPDEVIPKHTLKKQVWADTYVTDDVLIRCISELRKAFEDDARDSKIIQTIPRGGYRLIGRVVPEESPGESVTGAQAGSLPADVLESPRSRRSATLVAVVSATAVLVLSLLAWARGVWPFSPSRSPIKSLAILPMKNLSGNPEQDYFAEAMTDALITDLANISTLQVASRTSVARYSATDLPISTIAKQLNVDALVEGSVMPVGNRVRITAQLIDGRSDRHLWSATYERDYKDVLFLQKDVAQAVAEEISTQLTPREKQRLGKAEPVDPQAYEAYVKGRYFWNQRTRESLEKAVEYFETSVKQAPGFALAYAGLADTYNLLANYGFRSPDEAFTKSKAAALKAMQLDESAAEPYASLALVSMSYDRNWQAAERELRRAIELNPSYASAHHWLALCLIAQAKTDEAVSEAERACRLDPVSLAPGAFLAQCLLWARRYEDAATECFAALELHPEAVSPRIILAESYWRQGKVLEAVTEIDRVKQHWRDDPRKLAVTRAVIVGDRIAAAKIMEDLVTRSAGPPDPMFCAQIHALLGNTDEAFQCLNEAFARRDSSLLVLKVDPTFDSLHADPRFQSLAKRLGLG
jgi:TolB-like protein/DNA-binding winged helix-turn-helix (wHTH) protein